MTQLKSSRKIATTSALRRATMADVATAAGVSQITVWRALNSPDKVSHDTRTSIARAIEHTGYVPDLTARSLVSQRSRLAAAIVPNIQDPVFGGIIQKLSDRLEEREFQLLLGSTSYSPKSEFKIITTCLSWRVDGIVVTGCLEDSKLRRLLKRVGVPVVETWNISKRPVDMSVGFSNAAAAQEMTGHLIKAGYRRIALSARAEDTNDRTRDRYRGFLSSMNAAGLEPAGFYEFDEQSVMQGASLIRRLSSQRVMPDAIFFTSDILAVGAMDECRRLGIRIPQQLGIAGFGDLDIGSLAHPALTTVRTFGDEIGNVAAECLIARFEGRRVDRRVVDVGFEIVSRESTARS